MSTGGVTNGGLRVGGYSTFVRLSMFSPAFTSKLVSISR